MLVVVKAQLRWRSEASAGAAGSESARSPRTRGAARALALSRVASSACVTLAVRLGLARWRPGVARARHALASLTLWGGRRGAGTPSSGAMIMNDNRRRDLS